MRRDLPQWVISYCRHWGSQKRRIWDGKDWYGNVDGYAQSLIGRIREERDGTCQGERKQHWPEVMWGHGLDVQRVISGMPERPYYVGHAQYVFPNEIGMTVTQKAALIDLSKADYWRELEIFEFWLFARLDSVSDWQASKRPLQLVAETPTVKRIPAKLVKVSPPEINIAALRRQKLSLNIVDPEKPAA